MTLSPEQRRDVTAGLMAREMAAAQARMLDALANPAPYQPRVPAHQCDAQSELHSREFGDGDDRDYVYPPEGCEIFPVAIERIERDARTGYWYATNGEYSSWIAFCPFCGIKLETLQ